MKNFEQIELILIMTFALSLIPCGITYWISRSFIYTFIPFVLILLFVFQYENNNRDRKEIMSIFQDGEEIHFLLGGDNWSAIKLNKTSDISKAIMDRLKIELIFLKSHIKRIDLINIDNRQLQDQLNRLIVS